MAGTTLESILGLGAIYEQTGNTELQDLQPMIAMLENDLKSINTDFRADKVPKKEWNRDEYDEVWGFDGIPPDCPDRDFHVSALADRTDKDTPTMLDEREWPDFHKCMAKRGTTMRA